MFIESRLFRRYLPARMTSSKAGRFSNILLGEFSLGRILGDVTEKSFVDLGFHQNR